MPLPTGARHVQVRLASPNDGFFVDIAAQYLVNTKRVRGWDTFCAESVCGSRAYVAYAGEAASIFVVVARDNKRLTQSFAIKITPGADQQAGRDICS